MRTVVKVEPEMNAETAEASAWNSARATFAYMASGQGLQPGEPELVRIVKPAFHLPPGDDGKRNDLISYIFEADAREKS